MSQPKQTFGQRPRGAVNPYLETRIKTAGPLELTAIMYDVLVSSLERAARAIEDHDVEGRVRAVNRAVSALVELRCALDFDRGGEMAVSLDRLYSYGLSTVTQSPVDQKAEDLVKLQSVFAPLRDAWQQASHAHEAEPAADQVPAPAAVALAGAAS